MTLRHRITLRSLIFVTASMLSPAAWAQDIEPGQRYLLLATERTGTMQKELDTAAAAGFRVRMGSHIAGDIIVIFMERVAEPPNTYTYLLLSDTNSNTMQEELDKAAAQGYRLLPRTVTWIDTSGFFSGGREIVAIVELAPGETRRYEYKLLATRRTSTLQREVTESAEASFVLAALVGHAESSSKIAIMERQAQ